MPTNVHVVLNDADDGLAIQLLKYVTPVGLYVSRATSRSSVFNRYGLAEGVWADILQRDFGLSVPVKPPAGVKIVGTQPSADTSAGNYAMWALVARELKVEHVVNSRVIAVWFRLMKWFKVNQPTTVASMRPPLSEADCSSHWSTLSESAGLSTFPRLIFDIWRVYDGQDAEFDDRQGGDFCNFLELPSVDEETRNEKNVGLIGGYSAYDHEICITLLPMHAAVKLTQFFQQRFSQLPEAKCLSTRLVFACSSNLSKFFVVDLKDGMVYHFGLRSFSFTPCVPRQAEAPAEKKEVGGYASSNPPLAPANVTAQWPAPQLCDGLLRWLEEFASRLEGGIYRSAPLKVEEGAITRGLNLFPQAGPTATQAVTKGVEITASCVYMPEHPSGGFTYSIRMRLVGTKEERGYETCQLHLRHWVITGGPRTEHVNGEGVIGLFPILSDQGWIVNKESDPHQQYGLNGETLPAPFVYQSCSGRSGGAGTFGGEITFVPGTIKKPTGPPFRALVETFKLEPPEFLY